MRIAIFGAGWYGCHIALSLEKKGHEVFLFEKNDDIFQQISGNFGIRLHSGAHYPRSPVTRQACLDTFERFKKTYPDLVVEHDYANYLLGKKDAVGQQSHVSALIFDAVCREFQGSEPINTEKWGYKNVISAYNMPEPSLLIGKPLREKMWQYLKNINVILNCQIDKIESNNNKMTLRSASNIYPNFDKVINATSYQALLPEQIPPFSIEINYQVCLGLLYRDSAPQKKPFSMIVMDGLYPCLMPYLSDDEETNKTTYLLTHGSYTLMNSSKTLKDAQSILSSIDEDFINNSVRPACEREMNRFWPEFGNRFSYSSFKATILAKPSTSSEYRSAMTYEYNNVIHIFPGKVSNIFNAEDETIALINNENIVEKQGFRYTLFGALNKGQTEIATHPGKDARNTSNIQTFHNLKQHFWTPAPVVLAAPKEFDDIAFSKGGIGYTLPK